MSSLYTTAELQAMSAQELEVARANGYVRPESSDLRERAQEAFDNSRPAPPQDPYAVTSWGEREYDHTVPSGQRCRMRKLRPEELIERNLLDRITRLPGFSEEEIRKAEGKPPTPQSVAKEDMQAMLEILEQLIPIVVVQPVVHSSDTPEEERVPGSVTVRDIELADRIDIMNRALSGVSKMDNFREKP